MKNPIHILTTICMVIFGRNFTSAQNITANFSSHNVCFNNSTCFTDLSTSTFSIISWDWYLGDSSPHVFLKNPCYTYTAAGNYIVRLIVTNSNGGKDTVDHIATVNPLPIASFASTTVCPGNPTCFTDLSTISSGVIKNWSWNFGDPASGGSNNISNLQNPCHTYTISGQFTVLMTITSDSGCQATSMNSVTVNVCTGIQSITESKLINVYPNPFFSQTTLITGNPLREATLTVYNSFGEMVKQIDNLSGQTIIFNRDHLPGGLYFVRLTENNKIFATDKLIITD